MSLITEGYRAQNVALHKTKASYGTTSGAYAVLVWKLAVAHDAKTILDYGAGKRLLKQKADQMQFGLDIQEYDPAVPEISEPPTEPVDFLVCIDVLEHIEPACLSEVLNHMESLTNQIAFVTVCCRKAHKTLEDGRNAHLIVENSSWWVERLLQYWDLQYFQSRDCPEDGFEALLRKRAC